MYSVLTLVFCVNIFFSEVIMNEFLKLRHLALVLALSYFSIPVNVIVVVCLEPKADVLL